MVLSDDLFRRIVGGAVRIGDYRAEKRSSDRVPLLQRGHCAVLGAGRVLGPRRDCLVRELSMNGTSFVSAPLFPAGSDLVLFVTDSDRQEIAIECRVVRAVPSGESAKLATIGATFTRLYQAESEAELQQQAKIDAIRAAVLS